MTEAVAWLYTAPNGNRGLHLFRADEATRQAAINQGWTETPLYPAEALRARDERISELEERLRKANKAEWFYYGDDPSSDQCRDSIDECISEDFEWCNKPKGDHVLQISGAKPVPDMWVALRYFTEAEMDERQDDADYVYTVHATEEEARQALKEKNDVA